MILEVAVFSVVQLIIAGQRDFEQSIQWCIFYTHATDVMLLVTNKFTSIFSTRIVSMCIMNKT